MKKEQTIVRNKIYGITFGIAFVCVMLFAACGGTLLPSDENGYGRISILIAGGEARTVLPSTAFDKYVYTFTKSGGAAVVKAPDKNGLFTLELGTYTVEVKAYIGAAEPYTLVASGVSSQFTVSSGSNAAVIVKLNEVNTGGQGRFTYTITYPAGAAAEITLQKWPGLNNITLNPGNITNGKTQTLQLDAGSYLLAVLINKNGSSKGISEAVHIISSLSTVYTKNFDDNDLIAPLAALTSISQIGPYLASVSGGLSSSDPVSLPLGLPLGSTAWYGILSAIDTAGKYVDLDLSACTRSSSATGAQHHQLKPKMKVFGCTCTCSYASTCEGSFSISVSVQCTVPCQ